MPLLIIKLFKVLQMKKLSSIYLINIMKFSIKKEQNNLILLDLFMVLVNSLIISFLLFFIMLGLNFKYQILI